MAEISKELKYVILAHAIVFLLFGIWFFFFIENYVDVFQWLYLDPIAGHYIGGFLLAGGIINILIYFKETEWDRIECYVIFLILFCLLGLIAQIWGSITDFTAAGIFNAILHAIFLVAYTYFFLKQRK